MARTYPKHTAAKASGSIPATLKERRAFLEKELKKYQGKTFHCKVLGVNVMITNKSVEETVENACISNKATELALYLPHIIRNAQIIELHLPTESRKQTRTFHFKDIGVFKCNIQGIGTAKIVIGFRKNGRVIEYSITDYKAQ